MFMERVVVVLFCRFFSTFLFLYFCVPSISSADQKTSGSIITLINGVRFDLGKGPVGFINPVIYRNPEAFHDITSGGNQGCGTPGYTAVPGWDPVCFPPSPFPFLYFTLPI